MLGPTQRLLRPGERRGQRRLGPFDVAAQQREFEARDVDVPQLMARLRRAVRLGFGQGLAEMRGLRVRVPLDQRNTPRHL